MQNLNQEQLGKTIEYDRDIPAFLCRPGTLDPARYIKLSTNGKGEVKVIYNSAWEGEYIYARIPDGALKHLKDARSKQFVERGLKIIPPGLNIKPIRNLKKGGVLVLVFAPAIQGSSNRKKHEKRRNINGRSSDNRSKE